MPTRLLGSMIAGRKTATKNKLIRLLCDLIQEKIGIADQDIDICIFESPACNWRFRGMHGEEVQWNYNVNA